MNRSDAELVAAWRRGERLRRRELARVQTFLLVRCAEELEHVCDHLGIMRAEEGARHAVDLEG